MAVTKIRKVSSWTLLITSIISLVVLGMFYAGGVVDPSVEMKEPILYRLIAQLDLCTVFVTIISTVIFALWQFASLLKTSPKSALTSLIVVVCFAAMLFITYSIGDPTPLKGLNTDSQEYNIPLWLKVTDMWIYSTVVLMILIIIAVAAGSVKRMLNR